MPTSNRMLQRVVVALPRDVAEAGGRAAQQILVAGIGVGERQRLFEITDVRGAVRAQQADGRGNGRLRLLRRRLLHRGQRAERILVADLAKRRRRIVLQRPFELGDLDRARGIAAAIL